jgi:hypothetical protein
MKKGYSIPEIAAWKPCQAYPVERGYIMFGNDPVTIERALSAKYDKVGDLLWLILRDEFLTKSEQRKIFKWALAEFFENNKFALKTYMILMSIEIEDKNYPNLIRVIIGSMMEFGRVEESGWRLVEFIKKLVEKRRK